MRVIAVVSARGGSKGVPRKNLLDLGGVPLISHVILKALKCKNIDKVVCSTDSLEIAEVATRFGAEVPFIRPPECAADRTPLIDSTKYAMMKLDAQGCRGDVIVQISPTCPFLTVKNIERSVELVLSDKCDSAVSLQKIEHEHPYRARILDRNTGTFSNFITEVDVEARQYHSRQDLPLLYCTSGGIYTRKRKLLEDYDGSNFAMGLRRMGIVLDDIEAVNIDRQIDFDFASFLADSGRASNYL